MANFILQTCHPNFFRTTKGGFQISGSPPPTSQSACRWVKVLAKQQERRMPQDGSHPVMILLGFFRGNLIRVSGPYGWELLDSRGSYPRNPTGRDVVGGYLNWEVAWYLGRSRSLTTKHRTFLSILWSPPSWLGQPLAGLDLQSNDGLPVTVSNLCASELRSSQFPLMAPVPSKWVECVCERHQASVQVEPKV